MTSASAARPARRYRNDGRPAGRLTGVQERQRAIVQRHLDDGTYRWEAINTCSCGIDRSITLSEKDRFGFPAAAVACLGCGLVRTTPRLAPENLPAFYEHDYHALHMGIVEPGPTTTLVRPGQGGAIYSYAAPHLRLGALRVAEVGAGSGGVLREFAAAAGLDGRSTELIGCEYSVTFAQVAVSLGTDIRHGGVEVLLDQPPPDLLILSHVLEHLPDPRRELATLWAWLEASSLVYVEVPGLLTLHEKVQYDFDLLRYLTIAHTFHFTLATLVDTMATAGFRLVKGDEEVRSLFVPASDGELPSVRPSTAADLVHYLDRLDRSPGLKLRRARMNAWRAARPRLRALTARVLGEDRTRSALARIRGNHRWR